jgi:pSer/pThr/pTyr-binding forkhead associated (FHA) protein
VKSGVRGVLTICWRAQMAELTLEIVEGPGAGRQIDLDRPVVIGRAPEVDLVLEDGQVSRHHARVSPADDGSAVVEDLESANGTFVNHNELHGPARLDPSDELLIGVTLIEVRSKEQVAAQASVMRAIPPALASAPRTPDFISPAVASADAGGDETPRSAGMRELDKFLDVRVRRRAQLAPLALLTLIALALIIYFATQ